MPLNKYRVRKGFMMHRVNLSTHEDPITKQKTLVSSVSVHQSGTVLELDPKEAKNYAHQLELIPVKKEVAK